MCDSYGAAESPLVSVRSIVAPGVLGEDRGLDLALRVAGQRGLHRARAAVIAAVAAPARPPRPLSACTAVAWKDELTSTTFSVPPDVLMCA